MSLRHRRDRRLLLRIGAGLAAVFAVAAGGTRQPQQAADVFTFFPVMLPDQFSPSSVFPLPDGWGDLTSGQQGFVDRTHSLVGSFTVQDWTAVIEKAFTMPGSGENLMQPRGAILGPDRNLWGEYDLRSPSGDYLDYGVYRCDGAGHFSTVSLDFTACQYAGCQMIPSIDGSQAGPFVYLWQGTRLAKITTSDPITVTFIQLPIVLPTIGDCMVFGGSIYCGGRGGFVTIRASGVVTFAPLTDTALGALTGTTDGNLLFVNWSTDALGKLTYHVFEVSTAGTILHQYAIPNPVGLGHYMARLANGKYCFSEEISFVPADLVFFDKDAGTFDRVNLPHLLFPGFGTSGQSDYQIFAVGFPLLGLPSDGTPPPPTPTPPPPPTPTPSGPPLRLPDLRIRAIGPSDLAPRSP